MSSNVAVLTLGMVLAGRLTDSFGPRWIWGVAALLSSAAAVVGFALARGTAVTTPHLAAPAAEPGIEPQTAPDTEAAVQAQERAI
jgi:MFS family permease